LAQASPQDCPTPQRRWALLGPRMGQQNSGADNGKGGAIICCTSRGDDEARATCDSLRHTKNQDNELKENGCPSMVPPRLVAEDFGDGGTGGTGTARQESGFCDATEIGFIDLGAFTCVENRDADTAAGRRVLFGDKSLKPKLLRLRTCEAEVEALLQIRTQISKRLPDEEGKPVAIPAVLEAGEGRITEAELVRRLRLHEESLAGVPEKFVTQACTRTLSRFLDCAPSVLERPSVERSVEVSEMKKHYAEILTTVDTLVQERVSELHAELAKLDAEVGEIEDIIAFCFDKMDEEGEGSISSGRFVAFVCDSHGASHGKVQSILVSPQDAESLFLTMSQGQGELTFQQFKDEITAGCLQVMQSNITLRRISQKRYRDCAL